MARLQPIDLEDTARAGSGDSGIVEIVKQVALSILTNYFSELTGSAVDFPLVRDFGSPGPDPSPGCAQP